jgi:hypothetical protein
MLAKLCARLSYANVMATFAVFMTLGGGVAWALGTNSVKSKHIVDGQVKSVDLAPDAVDGAVGDQIDTLAARIDLLEEETADQQGRISALETLLAGVSRGTLAGRDTMRFSNMNVQLTNGTQSTASSNGLGNLIVGYNATRTDATRSGSHNIIVGDMHEWTSYGGIVAGNGNTASGVQASVLGLSNTASGNYSTVTGGQGNVASGLSSSVSGGARNAASGSVSSVSGGSGSSATGDTSSVSGGLQNTASGRWSSILGYAQRTVGELSCFPACLPPAP